MEINEVKQKSVKGIIWKLLEKGGTQVVSMIIQIFLARLLLPEEYGIIAYVPLFTNIAGVLIDQGLSSALVQKRDADDLDCSSVFYINLVMSILAYGILFFAAPYIAQFYHEERLTVVMRVLSLTIVIGSFTAVHGTLITKNLEFNKVFIISIVNIASYGLTGISLAYLGFGVWSLVLANLLGSIASGVARWFLVKWKPKLIFSFARVKSLFHYGFRLMLSSLSDTFFSNINTLIIGHYYATADLGYYQRGQNIPHTIMTSLDGSLTAVSFPTFSQLQGEMQRLKNGVRRTIKISTYIVFPMLIGLAVISKPLTLFLLTEKWLESVPFMQITCVACILWPFAVRMQAVNSIGRSDVTLKANIIVTVLSIASLVITAQISVMAIMVGNAVIGLIDFLIASYISKKYINYSLKETILDVLPQLAISVAMGIVVWLIGKLPGNYIVLLFVQIIVGIGLYVGASILFRVESFDYSLKMVKNIIQGRKGAMVNE